MCNYSVHEKKINCQNSRERKKTPEIKNGSFLVKNKTKIDRTI